MDSSPWNTKSAAFYRQTACIFALIHKHSFVTVFCDHHILVFCHTFHLSFQDWITDSGASYNCTAISNCVKLTSAKTKRDTTRTSCIYLVVHYGSGDNLGMQLSQSSLKMTRNDEISCELFQHSPQDIQSELLLKVPVMWSSAVICYTQIEIIRPGNLNLNFSWHATRTENCHEIYNREIWYG